MRIHGKFFVVAAVFVAVMFHSKVHASLNLTFDVTKLTYSWTGTATSPLITVPIDSINALYVIGQPYAGGLGAITMPGGPITVTLLNSSINDYFAFEAGDGSPNVIMNFPSIWAPVAYFDRYSSGGATEAGSIVLQIVGNGVEVSYAGVNPIVRDQISNMEGVPLYLRHHKHLVYVDPPNQIEILPTQIGSIHVVPEPSTYALLLMTGAAIWHLRRRRL